MSLFIYLFIKTARDRHRSPKLWVPCSRINSFDENKYYFVTGSKLYLCFIEEDKVNRNKALENKRC